MNERVVKAEKMEKVPFSKPVPMKLFAAWEVDRTSPCCVPRLCSLKITKLSLFGPLPSDVASLSLAVKMESSKRTLRSHEIVLLCNPTKISPAFEVDLDLHFSLQYPHFLKRDGNRLMILLQRRKKYKSRTILGYKTLAEGVIKMDFILQKSVDLTVDLVASGKSKSTSIATVRANQISSVPVDADGNKNTSCIISTDRTIEYSDDEEEPDFSSNEDIDDQNYKRRYSRKSTNYRKMGTQIDPEADYNPNKQEIESDSELENFPTNKEKGSRTKLNRRNFKQKIVALLRRFKVPEELEGDSSRGPVSIHGEQELDALFQELESLSCGEDSGQEIDNASISSTPKPSLRPFFTPVSHLKGNQSEVRMESCEHSNQMLDFNVSSNQQEGGRPSSIVLEISSEKGEKGSDWKHDCNINEMIQSMDTDLAPSDQVIPSSPPKEKDSVDRKVRLFRSTSGTSGAKKKQFPTVPATNENAPLHQGKSNLDVCLSPTNVEPRKTLIEHLNRIFPSETNPLPEIMILIGPQELYGGLAASSIEMILSKVFSATFISHNTADVKAILSALVNKIQKHCNLNSKPPNTVKLVLIGGDWIQGVILRYYVELLGTRPPDWIQHIRFYVIPIGPNAIARYLNSIDSTYGSLFGTENWTQLCEKLAIVDVSDSQSDGAEIIIRLKKYIFANGPCTQVPIAEAMVNYKEEESCQIFIPFISDVKLVCTETTTSSVDNEEYVNPNLNASSHISGSPPHSGRSSPPIPLTNFGIDAIDLQIDYWSNLKQVEVKEKVAAKDKDQGKCSIKSHFRTMQVWRLPPYPLTGEISNSLTLCYLTREKKQKIMRLGKKKEKDRETEREQIVDNISRIICSPKSQHSQLRVYIDGTEWTGVKFFQLSSQWQTHVRNFPIALIRATNLAEPI